MTGDVGAEFRLVPVLGDLIEAAGGRELRFCCPRCVRRGRDTADTDHHLFVNPEKELFICHRCGWKGPLAYLYRTLRIDVDGVVWSGEDTQWNDRLDRLINPPPSACVDTDTRTSVDLPPGLMAIPRGSNAERYLLHRGFTPRTITERGVLMGTTGRYKGMIVFPEYTSDGQVLYWTTKCYTGRSRRPLNADAPKGRYVYWLDQVPSDDVVFIGEGVFDAIVYGRHGVAIFGHEPTRGQLDALIRRRFRTYYWSFDGDAMESNLRHAHRLFQDGLHCKIVQMDPWDDPNSVYQREGSEGVHRLVQSAWVYHPDEQYRSLI